ncbi:enoyl-CoA hydratase domain-containing protein 2, mitochondrial-like isoform X2 [Babylonia areolata]
MNSMGRNFMQMFLEGVHQVRFDNAVRCVVVCSDVPGVFCAGADLKERAEMSNEEVAAFVQNLRFIMSELAALPMPTIAAIDGAALGGGLEMALACDLRIAASNAKIGQIETSRGLLPGAGGSQRLPRTIGVAKAKELIFTSRVVDGDKAEEMGLVNHSVPQNSDGNAAFLRSLDLADEILPQGPVALRMAKMAINHGTEVDISSGMKFEEAYYAGVIPTKDRIEGLTAFREKRKPVYKGH